MRHLIPLNNQKVELLKINWNKKACPEADIPVEKPRNFVKKSDLY
jgi:hypothetical protein